MTAREGWRDSGAALGIKLLLLLVCALYCSGCWDKRELDDIGIVSGVGLDYEKQNIIITAQILKPGQLKSSGGGGGGGESGGQSGGGKKAVFNVSAAGKTPFRAVAGALDLSSRRLNFTHNELLILGKDLAQSGTRASLDFFYRFPETRPTQWVLVAEDKASDIFQAEPGLENFLAAEISHLIKTYSDTSEIAPTRLQDFMNALASKSTSPVAPIVKTVDQDGKKRAVIAGSAVFRDDKWVGNLTKKETRGYLWVAGKVQGGVVALATGKKDRVDITILHATGQFQAKEAKGKLRIQVKIRMEGNIGSLETETDLATPQGIKYLEKLTAREIRQEVGLVFKKAAALHGDIFGIGDALYRANPQKWPEVQAKLDQLLSAPELKITVATKLRLVGEISKPVTRE